MKLSINLGFLEALTVLFIALKLLGFIDWSWWWITAPFLGGAVLFASAIAFVAIMGK